MFGLREFLDDMRRGLDAIFSNQHAIVNLLSGQAQRLLMIERRLQTVSDTTTTTQKSVADLDAVIAQLPAATAQAVTAAVVPAVQAVLDPIAKTLAQKNAQTADVDLTSEINTLTNFPGSLGTSLAQTLPGAIAANLQTSLGTSGSASSSDTGATTTGTESTNADANSTPATPTDGSTAPADGSTPSGGQ